MAPDVACDEGDGYVVRTQGGFERVYADHGGTRLEATTESGAGNLPDNDVIGEALVDARVVSWADVLHLKDD